MQPGKKGLDYYLAGLIGLVVVVGIIFMPRQIYIGDPIAIQFETIHFFNTGSLDLPKEVVLRTSGERGQYFFQNNNNQRWYSKYGIFNDVIIAPPLLLEKILNGGNLPFASNPPLTGPRVVFLNLYNILLSVGIGFYLYSIVGRYSNSRIIAIIFVLTSLYCTYWWNYLRAQNSEIYQTLFVLGFYYHFTGVFHPDGQNRSEKRNSFVLAGIYLGMLILVKDLYLVLIPSCLLALLYNEYRQSGNGPESGLVKLCIAVFRSSIWFLVPLTGAFVALLWINWYKFGSPFETGYGEWSDAHRPYFSGDILAGASGLLFGMRDSVFLYFPVFTFGLIGMPQFARRCPVDTFLFVAMGVTVFLLISKMFGGQGGWCYGPRYMLTMLPLLSLPFIQTLTLIAEQWRKWWVTSLAAVMAVLLLFSLRLQLNVNALPFMVFFELQSSFGLLHDAEVDDYFNNRTPGMVNGDLLAHKQGKPWIPLQILAAHSPSKIPRNTEAYLKTETESNYYWWP